MKYSTKLLSQTLIQICQVKGTNHIVISPGSRNAPLTIGFIEHADFNCFSVVDERCAAFFALGMAQQLKIPVVLTCTSGSALLNYYPAIAEAFYSDIPLVIISADRPKEFINIGDGQTIQQENVFANHILYNANCKDGKEHLLYNENEINTAFNIAIAQQGPVHINIPFSEPLYNTVDELQVEPTIIPDAIPEKKSSIELNSFVNKWNNSRKKIILIGALAPNSIERKFIDQIAEDESVVILTETTSNIYHHNLFPSIDQLIAPLEEDGFKILQPDILITFGGMIVSKKIKAFLRKYSPEEHWHVDTKKAYDTYFCLKHHFETTPNNFLNLFLEQTITSESTFQKDWLKVKQHRLERQVLYEAKIPYSDFKVFSEIVKTLPSNIQLQLSNSATIRYSQLFNLDKSIEVYCNRGTSGIEGSTSTAIGAACVSEKPTVFITGDLSFLYDSNGLWNNYIPDNFKIIVINNGGGGIFRILPGDKNSENFHTYFETKHDLTAEHLCKMYEFDYSSITNEVDLHDTLKAFFKNSFNPNLLEIFTPSDINDKVLLDYFKFIK